MTLVRGPGSALYKKKKQPTYWTVFMNDWEKFKKTNEYKRLSETMLTNGMKQPYVDNIIHRIFYAGYFNMPFIVS